LIQDEANDRLIRLRTDLEAARHNVRALEQRLDRPSGKVSAGRPSRGTARPA
jgi:hypothetical protein